MIDLSKAVAYANRNWFRPCEDGVVWNASTPMSISAQIRDRKLKESDWAGLFIFYSSGSGIAEGLFLVPTAEANAATLKSRGFKSENFPNKHFICSWSDATKESTEGQTPPYTGLNDCSHFTSECLGAGGVNVPSIEANQFVGKLRPRPDVTTLCLKVDKEEARRVINSGLMTPGDVVAFSHTDGFHHAILYLGGKSVAAHTHSNHPDGLPSNLNSTNEMDRIANNWEVSANSSHPKVTLLHFTYADLDRSHTPWVPGWWLITWRGQQYFYHFTQAGRVTWTQKPPASTTAPPPAQPGGAGNWFARSSTAIDLCWTQTGTFEHLDQRGAIAADGTSNGDRLTGVRLAL